jgi:DNA-binding CsgD family transcriptional regulator
LRRLDEATLLALIGSIYEAGFNFSQWESALSQIVDAYGAVSGALTGGGADESDFWTVTTGIEDGYIIKYQQHYHDVNPIWKRTVGSPVGAVQTDAMVMPRAEFVRTEFFNDFMTPQGVTSMLGATAQSDQRRQVVLSVHGSAEFDDAHRALHAKLAPHLLRAVEISQGLALRQIEGLVSNDVLDQIGRGLLVVNDSAKILFANATAERLLEGGDLRAEQGIVRGRVGDETEQFHGLIRVCASPIKQTGIGGKMWLSGREGAPPAEIIVAPLHCEVPWFVVDRPVAVVIVNVPAARRGLSVSALKERFGLTAAESRFADEIVKGDGIKAVASRLGVSATTARTHLVRIFAKTGTHRQAELVRLLMSDLD